MKDGAVSWRFGAKRVLAVSLQDVAEGRVRRPHQQEGRAAKRIVEGVSDRRRRDGEENRLPRRETRPIAGASAARR